MTFRDRADGGSELAHRLADLGLVSPVVLGLLMGGVPVAAGVARGLGVGFDAFVAHRVGLPGREELGIAAVAEGLAEPIVSDASRMLGVGPGDLGILTLRAQSEIRRRVMHYRYGRHLPDLAGADVVLVEDGSATSVVVEAALRSLRQRRPHMLVMASPVCTSPTAARAAQVADEVVCAGELAALIDVERCYDDFSPVAERELLDLLAPPGRGATASLRLGPAGVSA
jgi:putative phosphoribosyl transferase